MKKPHTFALWMKGIAFYGLILSSMFSMLAGCAGFSFGPTAEPVTLKFTYFRNVADYETLAADFHNKHPNITIDLRPVDPRNNGAQLLTSQAGDMDVVRMSTTMITNDLSSAFLPLDLQISSAKDFPQDDLFSGSLDGLKIDGKQIGLPAGINPFVVFYSPKKFAAMGVRTPPPNWTLEEFVNTASAANNPDDKQIGSEKFGYGFCSHPVLNDGVLFTYLFGGGVFDSLTVVSRPTLNQPANVAALDWYASLKNDMHLIPDEDQPRNVGMLVARSNCGLWIDFLDRSTFGHYGVEDATPLPLPAYKSTFNVALMDGYFILAKSGHPEEAWQWISYLMGQQSASGDLIPPLKSLVDSQEYATRANKGTLSVARSLPTQMVVIGLEMYQNQRFGKVLQLFVQATTEVFKGTKDAQTALDEAQRQADSIFQ